MNEREFFKLLIIYIRRRIKVISLFCLFALIFAVVFYLHNLPIDAVMYAVILCACTGIIFAVTDFMQYYKRHKLLKDLQNNITISIDGLPNPKDIIEKDYIDLITIIYNDKIHAAFNADMKRSDLIDYYTLWAHQIKTPISAMYLLLQSEDREQNDELSMELFKIEQYVEFVLQYLRVESMSSDLKLKQYSLDNIVKQAVRKYAKFFIRKKINLNFKELGCDVLTDEKWLVFVIEQLLSNALKYTYEGTISIYMDPFAEKTLVIEDTGIGIQAEDLPRVFEKGFTGYTGRLDKKSTGIGLYLCKRILTKLSHTTTIKSKVGEGTKVLIDLSSTHLKVE
jgi:signal transduction histidine kinase